MIKVQNLQKYFNKKKQNEIHVINNVSLEFPDTGLVCLLGPSGSGKTTLLNVLGGLDSVESGTFIINNKVIDRYSSNKWDQIRNFHFGYIFQNYVLLPELNVYQNLEFVLKMLSLDKKEIEERINYALNAVGMIKYKKRFPNQLSGGQQQRIAIARALVKSPDVVIADEPTGNLDEKNTTQIMNIIKKVSKECLVILVTHERRLADFYGDKIIEILDGKVLNQINSISMESVLYQNQDNNIYLQEYNQAKTSNDELAIEYFYKGQKKKLELKVIFQDDTFYIKSNQDNINIKFLDKNSEIKVIDSKKPVINRENVEAFEYNLPKIQAKSNTSKSVLTWKETIKMAFSNLGKMRFRQKLVFLVFILSAIFVLVNFINIFSISIPEEKDFLQENRNLVIVEGATYDYEDLVKIEKDLNTQILSSQNKFWSRPSTLEWNIFRQTNTSIYLNYSFFPIELVEEPNVIIGRMPNQLKEVAIDKWVIDSLMNDINNKQYGMKFYDQFIGLTIKSNQDLKIVGILDNNNPNIYVKSKQYALTTISGLSTIYTGEIVDESMVQVTNYYNIKEYMEDSKNAVPISFSGLNEGEVLVGLNNINNPDVLMNINEDVIGVVTDESLANDIIISEEDITNFKLQTYQGYGFAVYAKDMEATISYLNSLNLGSPDIYEYYQNSYDRALEIQYDPSFFIVSTIILIASLLLLYFVMRSSLISRIYEVGVYRALGVKKSNIYKIFATEIFVITLISIIIGIGGASWFIINVNNVMQTINYPWYVSLVAISFILIFNLMIGTIPVSSLMRLTPSQILTKYDI